MADDTRRTVDPDLDPALIRAARAAGVRIVGRSAEEIRAAIPRAKAWREANRAAFEAWDEWYLKNGSPLDKYRQF
ncbi:type II toxin-antitoxin system CcdA family antitoxin [Minwuia sp.]|uniref:type II toxin-antitoxin system CcdA family antitoxin n=1 Tax=Minwuia sp. TaxID=2493630 RepID=UPI003A94F2A3